MKLRGMLAFFETGQNDNCIGHRIAGIAPAVHQLGGKNEGVTGAQHELLPVDFIFDIAAKAEYEFGSGVEHALRSAGRTRFERNHKGLDPTGILFPSKAFQQSPGDGDAHAFGSFLENNLAAFWFGTKKSRY